jgi:16S rRNA (guanine966-N2)-methyltransferase
MPNYRRRRNLKDWKTNRTEAGHGKLRVVGGQYRGRLLQYSGDPVTRPMKDYTREALFNLVGGWVKGKACFDLFAGTGAIGIEAISRGASVAYMIERHVPTLRIIEENVRSIDPDMNVQIHGSDSFFWVRNSLNDPDQLPSDPWVVFCCPPYALFNERPDDLIEMIDSLIAAAPDESLLVVESGEDFNTLQLPQHENWEIRKYSPAVISVFKKSNLQ